MRNNDILLKSILFTIIVLACSIWSGSSAEATTIANFPVGFTFTKNLKYGITDPDVMRLQQVLNTNPTTRVAVSGHGSYGNETSYFGPLTRSAVVRFQEYYGSDILTPIGLTSGTGYVGKLTRAVLNSIVSSFNKTASSNGCPTGYVCTPINQNQANQTYYNNTPGGTYPYNNTSGVTYPYVYGTFNTGGTNASGTPIVTSLTNGQTSTTSSIINSFNTTTSPNGCPTGYVCTPINQNQTNQTYYNNTNTGSTDTTNPFAALIGSSSENASSTASSTATSTKKTPAPTTTFDETLDDGSVTGVFPCTFTPGNFYIGLNVVSSVAFPNITTVTKTASSTKSSSSASSTTASSTSGSGGSHPTTTTVYTPGAANSLGDKHYIWVLGTSQLYAGGSQIGGGIVASMFPPMGATLDMLVKKTSQSCSPQGSGYLIEKAYIRQ